MVVNGRWRLPGAHTIGKGDSKHEEVSVVIGIVGLRKAVGDAVPTVSTTL